jgi:dolichol-phosphate mannosyltransferase
LSIAVVIPAYEEEKKIGIVVKGVKSLSIVDEVYVIDDGSSDRTAEVALREGAIVIRQPFNMGVGAALRCGFSAARKDGHHIIVVMGGDNQDEPRQIPRLLKPLIEDNYDFVQGSRWLSEGRTVCIPLFRKFTTKLYALILSFCTGFHFTDGTNGFRAFKTSILQKIDISPSWLNRYELEPYLLYKSVKLGLRIKEIGVTKSYSLEDGYTKMIPILDWWRILRPVIFLRLRIKK